MTIYRNEPVAIIGSACRLAGTTTSPSKLWDILRDPVDLRREIPPSRFNVDGFYSPDASRHGHSNVRHAYLLDSDYDLGAFDADFFRFKPAEAKATDPQQRFLLEIVYEALESAGMRVPDLRGSDTSVYVGVMFNDYATMLLRDYQDLPTYYATGTGQSILANRISYCFDWHGPSITIDTACSSSLVAVHMAVQSLRSGESSMAIACGANLIMGPEAFIIESKLNMLSPDGRSCMWDQDANGYARGDGVSAVVLKPLKAAIADGDFIQCVIREIGVNQDGATPGITMPSATAQEMLIRHTYARAGLDLHSPKDRPQYFEAHGTGTPAGDPIEAEAVYRSFSTSTPSERGRESLLPDKDPPLYVGSIKTVFGHTEGAAGVTSLIKVSLALQHNVVPPNLLLENLSDRVAPFYKNVEILRTPKPWPCTEGGIKRASVNSFGFGGTNAHAVVESFDYRSSSEPLKRGLLTPFVFSAFSEVSLRRSLSSYASYLETSCADSQACSLADLAWTLRERRSTLSHRVWFTASSHGELRSKIAAELTTGESGSVGIRTTSSYYDERGSTKRILGIFTGQGAQYARMGAELIESSSIARDIIRQLDSYLQEIEEESERPSWSLWEELLAQSTSSRVQEAVFSQPLCTAVQIMLVDILALANIRFAAVVGHSSGEIAAAYASGYISARDAIRIAYYRGLYSTLARSPNGPGIQGAMMAVGTSMDDMDELVTDELFVGRVTVAASNSSSSVTISGDKDALSELELVFYDEDKFCRLLKVDKAYHSNHMNACFNAYRDSIKRLQIQRSSSSALGSTLWFSSLRPGNPMTELDDDYWPENMAKPVLFSQALASALGSQPFDAVIEIGPHPALAGPCKQTMKDVLGKELPYHGTLYRGSNAVESLSDTLGYLWAHLGRETVSLDNYERAMNDVGDSYRYSVVQGLPTYQWNHETTYWHESRSSRKMRLRSNLDHPLLGHITPDSAAHNMRWTNRLSANVLDWLPGHAVQGQIVFPASGYLTSALEASRLVAEGKGSIRIIEIHDFVIHQAVPFEQEDSVIEVLIEMSQNAHRKEPNASCSCIRSHFSYSAAIDPDADDLVLAASGLVVIHLGEPTPSLLPKRAPATPHMIDIEPDRFYFALSDLGYNFNGSFRSLAGLRRKRGKSTCRITNRSSESFPETAVSLLIHPVTLDAILQSAIVAYSYPYDEELRTLHLPTTIELMRVVPDPLLGCVDGGVETAGSEVEADASIDFTKADSGDKTGIVANISAYRVVNLDETPHASIQIQGAAFKPLGGADSGEDRSMYSRIQWVPDRPDGTQAAKGLWDGESQRTVVRLLERIAIFYLRKFDKEIPQGHPARARSPTKWYLNHAKHVLDVVASGKQKWWNEEWENDTVESIQEASAPYSHLPDVEIMHLVGERMPSVFAGNTTMLEEFRVGDVDVLDRYYAEGIGLRELGTWVGRAVKQLADRHPHMKILEVGAGTGGATKAICREIGDGFLSYTYTDISAAFFETASATFSKQGEKMVYKTFDVEHDPESQGFQLGSYDLVIAFFVIHATKDMERSLRNIRKLLRPGGHLIIGEGSETGSGAATSGFIFGTLPGWWVGTESGRTLSPLISPREWNELLHKTGFSGADAAPPISVEDIFNVFPVVSQAVDDHINFLREPLSKLSSFSKAGVPDIDQLVIIGGASERSLPLVRGLQNSLYPDHVADIRHFKDLLELDLALLESTSAVISLAELDRPVFNGIKADQFTALKKIYEPGKFVFWVTSGRLCDEPYCNMTAAFGRVATHETADLQLQTFDIPSPLTINPQFLAEAFLRAYGALATKEKVDRFWAIEPEIVAGNQGGQLVPRLQFIPELNDRYNAGRRPISCDTDVSNSPVPVALQAKDTGYVLTELSPYQYSLTGVNDEIDDLLELTTIFSTLSAIKSPVGHNFLILGRDFRTDRCYLAFTSSIASTVKVPSATVLRLPDAHRYPHLSNIRFVALVASELICMRIFETVHAGATLLAHNVPQILAEALEARAVDAGVRIVFTADQGYEEAIDSSRRLPNYATPSDFEEILALEQPDAAYVGLSNDNVAGSDNGESLTAWLKPRCETVLTTMSIFSPPGSRDHRGARPANSGYPRELLQQAFFYAQYRWTTEMDRDSAFSFSGKCLRLVDIIEAPGPLDPHSMVDWTNSPALPVYKTRLDSGRMFKSHKSAYWIVGMSGALGISLADWMIAKGARNIVMSSRDPRIAAEWIECHRRKGAIVTVIPCDVTDANALENAQRTIRETLPPIRGVIHGAMRLFDISIRNMTYDQLMDVTRPKVDGAIHLNRMFYETDLDFFVLTSSINTVIGNLGQANYAAANAFMCSLAAQRRKRGFRAAAVNGGAIIGAGYMEREARRAWDKIAQHNYMMRLSEEDFVQSICEAIDASRLDSPYGPEISTGLNNVPFEARNQPFWSSDPMFSILIQHQGAATDTVKEGKKAVTTSAALALELEKCETMEELHGVILHAFAETLRAILQVNTSDEDLMASRSSDIGLDSLVSVNIRSWFLKHLQVGIPVLKIMGNDTMGNLVKLAVESIPAELVPHLNTSSSSQSSSEENDTPSSVTDEEGIVPSETAKDSQSKETKHGAIDWEAESRPPVDVIDVTQETDKPHPKFPPEVIVLTGSSGLLGHHLLTYLLNRTPVKKVICIAIRNLAERLKNKELPPANPRMEYHEGDLSAPLLGLSADQATSIFAVADAVIHNGADTSHMKGYLDVRASNVGSTIALAKLCLPRRIPLHYVSSVGLAILYGRDEFPPVSIADRALPAADGSFGYASAKWTCERLLERTHEMYKGEWPVCIHRPSTIIREGEDAVGTKANLDWVNALLHYARKSKTVPKIEHNSGALDLVHVENVCTDLVARVMQRNERMAKGEVGYVHEVGDVVLPLDRLAEVGLREENGGEVWEEVRMDVWIQRAVEDGMHPAVAALVEMMDVEGGPKYPRLLKEVHE